jgi:hypothetical protein
MNEIKELNETIESVVVTQIDSVEEKELLAELDEITRSEEIASSSVHAVGSSVDNIPTTTTGAIPHSPVTVNIKETNINQSTKVENGESKVENEKKKAVLA